MSHNIFWGIFKILQRLGFHIGFEGCEDFSVYTRTADCAGRGAALGGLFQNVFLKNVSARLEWLNGSLNGLVRRVGVLQHTMSCFTKTWLTNPKIYLDKYVTAIVFKTQNIQFRMMTYFANYMFEPSDQFFLIYQGRSCWRRMGCVYVSDFQVSA